LVICPQIKYFYKQLITTDKLHLLLESVLLKKRRGKG